MSVGWSKRCFLEEEVILRELKRPTKGSLGTHVYALYHYEGYIVDVGFVNAKNQVMTLALQGFKAPELPGNQSLKGWFMLTKVEDVAGVKVVAEIEFSENPSGRPLYETQYICTSLKAKTNEREYELVKPKGPSVGLGEWNGQPWVRNLVKVPTAVTRADHQDLFHDVLHQQYNERARAGQAAVQAAALRTQPPCESPPLAGSSHTASASTEALASRSSPMLEPSRIVNAPTPPGIAVMLFVSAIREGEQDAPQELIVDVYVSQRTLALNATFHTRTSRSSRRVPIAQAVIGSVEAGDNAEYHLKRWIPVDEFSDCPDFAPIADALADSPATRFAVYQRSHRSAGPRLAASSFEALRTAIDPRRCAFVATTDPLKFMAPSERYICPALVAADGDTLTARPVLKPPTGEALPAFSMDLESQPDFREAMKRVRTETEEAPTMQFAWAIGVCQPPQGEGPNVFRVERLVACQQYDLDLCLVTNQKAEATCARIEGN